ncbi:MAG: hypothetical protein CMJ83_03985 [Planctomycetes bacterium]|nr:hypothetical protein [Planctomycetota bacterium]
MLRLPLSLVLVGCAALTLIPGAAVEVVPDGLVAGCPTGPRLTNPDLAREIRSILSRNCFACHGPDEEDRQAGLRLDTRTGATAELRSGRRAVVPGDRAASALWRRITADDPKRRMPPGDSAHELKPGEITRLGAWIDAGAPWAKHWAFVKPEPRAPPAVAAVAWVRTPIDRYVRARQEREGLQPAAEADRYALLRRLTLDLNGLPPTLEEMRAFANDRSSGWYEKAVDRLLASPAYGERMARLWLDLARYADSNGYASDPLRKIWRWRDWVIDAFNRNQPYDRFTVEQLGGDLLPDATMSQKLATAFHRNTMTNTEGGTDDEEFRVAAVKDRVNTTGQVWMGLTLGCAQCHNHKFDPVSQEEYYRLFAVFNQTVDRDLPNDAPRLPTPTAEEVEKRSVFDREIAELERRMGRLAAGGPDRQRAWERRAAAGHRWVIPQVESAVSTGGGKLVADGTGVIAAVGPSPDTATYTIKTLTDLPQITGVRIEALPDPALPNGGPGRGNGNIVLNEVEVWLEPVAPRRVRGRYVRVELSGPGRILSLAEVEVAARGKNVARGRPARQSSTDYAGPAKYAVDGNTSGVYEQKSVTHTRTERDPWWEVDLGDLHSITDVTLWNRTDGDLETRLERCVVKVLDGERNVVFQTGLGPPPRPQRKLDLSRMAATVPLRAASATFSQDRFGVGLAIDADRGAKSGWALSPNTGRRHAAVFEVATPFSGAGSRIVLKLHQRYGTRHTLGRFRVAVTAESPPVRELPADVAEVLVVDASKRTQHQRARITEYWRSIDPKLEALQRRIEAKQRERDAIKVATTPVMQELPQGRRRTTHLMVKGNFLIRGQVVTAGLPAAFSKAPDGADMDRLALAQWLVSGDHPLTARVMVNRLWAMLFGTGLVETEENFGSQGAPPSHPELLDWLAVRFVESGWDVKAMLRLIVRSATYRQDATVKGPSATVDPRNRLLARGPRFRLEAETVRDQALAVSGLLSKKIGGPSVFPPQPKGLWRAAFNGGDRKWPTSMGEDRWRRGLYTFLRRTSPHPSLAMFDMPSREVCTVRRIRTNTPLQALATMNDPTYVEAAQALGRRIVREGGRRDLSRLRFALELCLQRPPQAAQVDVLLELLESERAWYRTRRDEAQKLATDPLGPLPKGMDPAELAAWTVVANVLLNLDAMLVQG